MKMRSIEVIFRLGMQKIAKVDRGGGWTDVTRFTYSSWRDYSTHDYQLVDTGFRLVQGT